MKTKILTLVLICFFVFAYCTSPADPEIEKALAPAIYSFTVTPTSIVAGNSAVLSWQVGNATTISIDQGIGNVDSTGEMEVSPGETTIYTLKATNNDGVKTASVTVTVTLPKAILEVITIPETPVFIFYPSPDWDETKAYSESQFTLVVTETNGVGGNIRIRIIWEAWAYWKAEGRFEPFGTLSSEINLRIHTPDTISYLKFRIDGTDDNGHKFDFTVKIDCISIEN